MPLPHINAGAQVRGVGVTHALSIEPWSLVRGATAIISPLGLTSTSVVAMLALLVGAIGTESCLRSA